MLISYPFLPARLNTMPEYAQLQHMLGLARRDEGLFPVSYGNRWHGGIHLDPGNDNEPVRAIADGEVVAYRVAAQAETYPPGRDSFDTSFVLIKHTTRSGENTPVVFYSLYMHLRSRGALSAQQLAQLPAWLRDATPGPNAVRAPQGTRIWRKDVLGFTGTLYNKRSLHFEIFATHTDFIGTPERPGFWRDRNAIAQGRHGSNDVFGDIHYIIPAGCHFVARHPHAVAPHRIDLPGRNAFYDLPVGQAGTNTENALHIVVRLNEGQRIATTLRILPSGVRESLGDSVLQVDYEYELYRLATALYPDCPSAGYEYLRFGRILSADRTATRENWQLIRYSEDAIGYIDLASARNNVSVLSDADFPLSWQRLEEGQAANASDGICDVRLLLELIGHPPDSNRNGVVDEEEFFTHAASPAIADKLLNFICKHPTEWDDSDIENRYRRLREPGQPLQAQDSWQAFSEHVNQMAFWSQTGIAERSVWHFHPLQFIRHYRACLWLSDNEFAQCIPRRSNGVEITWATALARARTHSRSYNQFIRKYCGSSRKRLAHNLSQTYEETGLLRTVSEDSRGQRKLYGPFYGRGYHQLTWAGNYRDYGRYKNIADNAAGIYNDVRITNASTHPLESGGQHIRWSPRFDPDIVSSDLSHAAEVSGFYWVSKSFRGRKNMNRVADLLFDPASVGFASWLVNGGDIGYPNRQKFARFLANVLLDDPPLHGRARFNFPLLSSSTDPTLCVTFPPASIPWTATETVDYERQIP